MGTSLVPHQLSPSYPLSTFFLDLHSGRSKTAKDSRSSIGYSVCMAIQRPHWPEPGTRVERNPSHWHCTRLGNPIVEMIFLDLLNPSIQLEGGRHALVIRRNTMRCIAGPTVTWGFPSGGSRHRVTLHCHHTFFFFIFPTRASYGVGSLVRCVNVCCSHYLFLNHATHELGEQG